MFVYLSTVWNEVPSFYTSRSTTWNCANTTVANPQRTYYTHEDLHLVRAGVDWKVTSRLVSQWNEWDSYYCRRFD